MQRAAASAPASSPTPTTPDEPSPKRQKLGADTPPSSTIPTSTDLRAIQAAVAAEQAKREEALERQAREAGETKWVLSFRAEERDGGAEGGDGGWRGALRVMSASYSGLDHESGSVEQDEGSFRPAAVVGRRSFGRFNRALEVSGIILVGYNMSIILYSSMVYADLSSDLEASTRNRRILLFIWRRHVRRR